MMDDPTDFASGFLPAWTKIRTTLKKKTQDDKFGQNSMPKELHGVYPLRAQAFEGTCLKDNDKTKEG